MTCVSLIWCRFTAVSWLKWVVVAASLCGLLAAPGLARASEALAPVDVVVGGFDAWGEFAASGDLAAVAPWFVDGSPQWSQFEAELPDLPLDGLAVPLVFSVGRVDVVSTEADRIVLVAGGEVSRSGFVTEDFSWLVELVRSGGGWQVWAVQEAQGMAPSPVPSSSTVMTTTTTLATSASTVQAGSLSAESASTSTTLLAVSAAPAASGVRLPVVGAWMVAVVIVGVAVLGFMAPRFDRRGV